MTQAIALRTDYKADDLRQLSRRSCNSKQTRRLLALALIYDVKWSCLFGQFSSEVKIYSV